MKIQILFILSLASCGVPANKKSEPVVSCTSIKIFSNSIFVDSLVNLIPLRKSDTTHFASLTSGDSTDILLQEKIFEIKIVRGFEGRSYIKYWFTRLAQETDSTKDFGLFCVLKSNNKAIESTRFRLNRNGEIIGVGNPPLLVFQPFKEWLNDTIPLPE